MRARTFACGVRLGHVGLLRVFAVAVEVVTTHDLVGVSEHVLGSMTGGVTDMLLGTCPMVSRPLGERTAA